MPGWLEDSPFPITFAVLFGIVFLRAQGTYWIGRAAHRRVAAHPRLAADATLH